MARDQARGYGPNGPQTQPSASSSQPQPSNTGDKKKSRTTSKPTTRPKGRKRALVDPDDEEGDEGEDNDNHEAPSANVQLRTVDVGTCRPMKRKIRLTPPPSSHVEGDVRVMYKQCLIGRTRPTTPTMKPSQTLQPPADALLVDPPFFKRRVRLHPRRRPPSPQADRRQWPR